VCVKTDRFSTLKNWRWTMLNETKSPGLDVEIGGLRLRNPVMTASGTFGYGEEYAKYIDLNAIGAAVVKGISLQPRQGNPPPRIMETPSGMLNAIGLANVGVEAFIAEKLPFLRQFDTKVVVNIYGEKIEEFVRLANILDKVEGIHALELNISCPNVQRGGIAFGSDPKVAGEVTRAVKENTRLPLIVKLTPNVTDITEIAVAVEQAGADAVSLINTLKGMSIDVERRIPHLKNITGGLSGPAIRPVAVRMVWEVAKSVSIPVVGMGGIMEARDALEFLIAGATAVQIGTANFLNPRVSEEVVEGIRSYLERHDFAHVRDLIGRLQDGRSGNHC
jgi:dihydroorotate dehydrogenase (NAD+) catalytic subunit